MFIGKICQSSIFLSQRNLKSEPLLVLLSKTFYIETISFFRKDWI